MKPPLPSIAVLGLLLWLWEPYGYGQILLNETIEGAASLNHTPLTDIQHAGGTDANIILASPGHGGAKGLKWLRRDSGWYYARTTPFYTAPGGTFAVSFWANLETTYPYCWQFALNDPAYRAGYLSLEASYNEWSGLRWLNPDGSYRHLCWLKTGWRQFKLEVDFVAKTCTVYYDDMRVPVGVELPLANPDTVAGSPFKPAFCGISAAGEAAMSVDDLTLQTWTPPAVSVPLDTGNHTLTSSVSGQSATIAQATGALTGLTWNAQPLLNDGNDVYLLQGTTTSSWAREAWDQVKSTHGNGSQRIFDCRNPRMPGIAITKTYSFDAEGQLLKKVQFNSRPDEGFVTYTARVAVNRTFKNASHPCGVNFAGSRSNLNGIPYRIKTDNTTGLHLYRGKVNDRRVLDGETASTADGWDMKVFCDYVTASHAANGEVRFQTFAGDMIDHARVLAADSHYVTLFNDAKPDWMKSLVCDTMYAGSVETNQMHQALQPLSCTSTIWFLNPPWGNWRGDSDPPLKLHPDVRGIAPGLRSASPNARVSAYTNSLFDRQSDLYARRAAYGVIDRDGTPQSGLVPSDSGGVPTYLLQIGNPAVKQYWFDMHADKMATWSLDFFYMDGPGAFVESQDWVLKKVIQNYEWLDFYRDLKTRLKSVKPDMAFFTNGMIPYSDIGYIESPDASWQTLNGSSGDWRFPARELLLWKVNEVPGHVTVLLYDREVTQPSISSYGIAYGWCGSLSNQRHIPWMLAALEYRGLQLIRHGILSPWWRQSSPAAEVYACRKGDSVIVNAIGHTSATSTTVVVNGAAPGLQNGRTYLYRVMTMNNPALNPDPGTAFTRSAITTVTPSGSTLLLTLPTANSLLTSVIISKALAVVEHTGAKACQTGIPENYGVTVILDTVKGTAYQYTVTNNYAGAVVFFPYATSATVQPAAAVATATVDGVSGQRVTFGAARTYSVTAMLPQKGAGLTQKSP